MMKHKKYIVHVAIASMLVACNGNTEKMQQQSLEDITKQELATALQERDELLSLVKEVTAGMEQIKQLENIMTVTATRPQENRSQKTRILADIASLKEKIQQRQRQISNLEEKLRDSTINNKDLQETIAALTSQLNSQLEEIESLRLQLTAANEHIGALSDEVDSLHSTVTSVTGERDAAQEASGRLENELNTCYYVVAAKSELRKHNIIESGFLRKTKLMKGDFDKGFFVISDKRMLDSLPLESRKAKILTNHPESSYDLKESNGMKNLMITDPDKFWRLSNFLVVQTD